MGGRMVRGSSLADARVAEKMGKDFEALEINVTDNGFPKELPGLALWEKAYEKDPRFKFGFATSVVLDPSGKYPLGTSGCGHTWEWDSSINYLPDKYLKFLNESAARLARLVEALKETDPGKKAADVKTVQAEILASLSEANRCKKPEPE